MSRLHRMAMATATVAALAVAGSTMAAPSAQAATTKSTPYLLSGLGNGLKVIGGSLPATSGTVAHVSSGCTNKAPLDEDGHLAGVDLPGGIGQLGAITTRTWTSRPSGMVNRYTQSKIASIQLGNALGSLTIKGLVITSRAWHSKSGFHSSSTATAASISGKLVGLPTPPLKLPTPSTPLDLPGLAKLSATSNTTTHGAHGAEAYTAGLTLHLYPTNTTLRLGMARATISDGVKSGLFGGTASATRLSLLGGTVTSTGQPRIDMKCKGTGGKVEKQSLAAVPLQDVGFPLSVSAATSTQMAKQTSRKATGYEKAYLANVNVGNGALVVKGLTAKANATRSGAHLTKLTTSKAGTGVASISLNGKTYSLSQLDGKKLSLPGGLLSIQTGVTSTIHSGGKVVGRKVIGLRLTLLDATDQTTSTVDLAAANFRIARA